MGAHDHGGHEAERPSVLMAHGADELRTGDRLHGGGCDDEIGGVLRHGIECLGRAFMGLDAACADGREHRPHHGEHGPAIVYDRYDKPFEITSKSAVMQH